jgi:hypothetical protein
LTEGATGDELIELIKEHYRLVLLTPEEVKFLTRKEMLKWCCLPKRAGMTKAFPGVVLDCRHRRLASFFT